MVRREYGEDYKIQPKASHLSKLGAVYGINKNLELRYNLDNELDKQYHQTTGSLNGWS